MPVRKVKGGYKNTKVAKKKALRQGMAAYSHGYRLPKNIKDDPIYVLFKNHD